MGTLAPWSCVEDLGTASKISGSYGEVPCLEWFGCLLGPTLVTRNGIYGIKVKFYMGQEMGWSLWQGGLKLRFNVCTIYKHF